MAEASDLRHRLQDEMDILMAFQSKICAQTDALKQRERKELDERVSARRLQLLQKVQQDSYATSSGHQNSTVVLHYCSISKRSIVSKNTQV